MSALIKVLLLGHPDPGAGDAMVVVGRPPHEADDFDTLARADDHDIGRVIAEFRPHVNFTFGAADEFTELGRMSIDTRRR